MKKPVCERRVSRVLMIFVVTLLLVSGAGAFETGVIVRGEDESPAAGYEVFGATVSSDDSALPGVLITLSGDGVNQENAAKSVSPRLANVNTAAAKSPRAISGRSYASRVR